MRGPIWRYGGKGGMTRRLLSLGVPEHVTYVEPYCGGASLLFAKPPSKVEVINDLDGGLVNFYRVLRDPEAFPELARLLSLTPYARAEFEDALDAPDSESAVEWAARFFTRARQAFSGNPGASVSNWSRSVTFSRRGMAGAVSKWLSAVDRLPEIHERLRRVQVERQPALHVVAGYDRPSTWFYVDPPYVPSTRKGVGHYGDLEMTLEDHGDLLVELLSAEGKVMLSGYRNELYDAILSGWRRVDFETSADAAGRTRASKLQGVGAARKHARRVESVWLNYG